MANVTLWGASYSDVPAIQVPKTGGGVAAFHDVTDTTAVASDVASGKLFHDANGALTAGTGSSTTVEPLSVTENGTYTAPTGTAYSPVTVNVSGGGGTDVNKLISGEMGTGEYTFTSTVLGRCFANTTGEFTLHLPNVVTIRANYPFENSQIAVIDMPNYERQSSGGMLFSGCSNLTTISLPKALSVASQAFNNCTSLVTAVINQLGSTWDHFRGCNNLEAVDLLSTQTRIDNAWQNGGAKMTTLILRGTAISPLCTLTTFNGTPFKSGGTGGTIYIPKSLYDHLGDGTALDYRNATNWSVIDGYGTITWAQIEGSYYETHYADGTEIPQGGTT